MQWTFKVEWNDYIGGHKERIKDHSFPKGIEAWKQHLNNLTADNIVWNYHWFPSAEVIYMSTFRSFIVLMGLRGVQPYMPLRVMRQLGRRQFIPPNEDMREFMYEFHPKIPLRQSEIFKIWGGCILSSPHDMVKDRTRGEVDQAYLDWVHDQPLPKVMPEGSIKGPIDREAEIEVKIKQARLKVERSYKSTLDILSNDLKNAKGELAQCDAILEVRVRKHHSTILTLQEDLGITTCAMEQHEDEYKKEKAQLICAV